VSLILGMDGWVFTAWIGTILAAAFCAIYGIYHEFIKKPAKKNKDKEAK
jgi:predicted outer membrane lipoprotein